MKATRTSPTHPIGLALFALALLLAVTARAQEPAKPATTATPAAEAAAPAPVEPAPVEQRDSFGLRLGAFLLTNIDTELTLSTAGGASGTLIDFGETLGGETSVDVFRADADWHFGGGAHEVSFSWYDIDLKGHREIDREIHWGDEIFPVHAQVDSRFRTAIYKLFYGYTFHRGQKHEFTGQIGAHVIKFDTSLTAATIGRGQDFDVTAPLPAIGLGWVARWTDRFLTRASVQYFGISLEDGKYSGHFTDLMLAGEYKLSRHWSIGGGYNRFELEVDVTREPLTLSLTNRYHGALVYLATHF